MLAVGLMSGTSLDGIDAAFVELTPLEDGYAVKLRSSLAVAFGDELAKRLRAAVAPSSPTPGEVAALDAELGAAFGAAAREVAGSAAIDFVASHGLTLFHDGERRLTSQIGDPFAIRERCGATVLFDFRRADCASGGHGAPLVPYFDALLLGSRERFRAALNLGGIANVTMLPPGAHAGDAVAWDVGPANMLLDAFVRRRTDGRESCDRDGRIAMRGSVDGTALRRLAGDAYFAQGPPKSTGRERFGTTFLDAYRDVLEGLSLEDGCATLTALTADMVASAILSHAASGDVAVSGGGVHNATLLREIALRLPAFDVFSTARLGIDPDYKEAIAFAVLGYELLRGRPAGLPRVTGAERAVLLGAIAPLGLEALLGRVREELGASTRHGT